MPGSLAHQGLKKILLGVKREEVVLYILYALHESPRILDVSVLHVYFTNALHVYLKKSMKSTHPSIRSFNKIVLNGQQNINMKGMWQLYTWTWT